MTRAERYIWDREIKLPGTTILRSGWPDFLIIREAEIKAIEVKLDRDRLSRSQIRMHRALRKIGIPVEVERVTEFEILLYQKGHLLPDLINWPLK